MRVIRTVTSPSVRQSVSVVYVSELPLDDEDGLSDGTTEKKEDATVIKSTPREPFPAETALLR